MKVLELYSGIGGMHLALTASGVDGVVVASMEINNIANEIYKHNFPNTKLVNCNIEGLSANFINDLNVDTILMSPPCQPFTRNGLKNDINDPRTASFLHILKLLPDLEIEKILIENVKGFEASEMRNILVKALRENKFSFQEFILSPSQIGVPNSRSRYYCLAKKNCESFSLNSEGVVEHFPLNYKKEECFPISEVLEENVDKKYFLADKILEKRLQVLDICYKDSKRSCCFTKAYGRFLEGTGSVFTEKTENEVSNILEKYGSLQHNCDNRLELLKSLKLRFFTPREICRLMCFPECFSFPSSLGDRKKYMMLGNSINVQVVANLIQILNT